NVRPRGAHQPRLLVLAREEERGDLVRPARAPPGLVDLHVGLALLRDEADARAIEGAGIHDETPVAIELGAELLLDRRARRPVTERRAVRGDGDAREQ